MPDAIPAWLLQVSNDIQFCIGENEAEAYVDHVDLKKVPLTAGYSNQVIFWGDMILPVVDMSVFAGYEDDMAVLENTDHVFIVSCQQEVNMPLEYVAFKLMSVPEKIVVKDESVCELPEDYPDSLKPYLLSLFKYNGQLTSVFDISKISAVDSRTE